MRTVAGLLLLANAMGAYTGSAICGRCHRAIAESYAKTGMARSFRSVQPGVRLPEFDGRAFSHQASRQKFTPIYDAGRNRVSREQAVAGFAPYRFSVDYVLGSGTHARSYLHRTAENKLEFPVSWYARKGGYWDMSPGYDRPGHQGFSREIDYRCMFCHNAYPRAAGADGGAVFPAELPEGIDCERCHGPGEQHVREPRRGTIVNPARLAPEQAMEVCLQCHLETTSGDLPGDRLRPGRDVFSYRPGEALGDYRVYFDHAPNAGLGDKFEIVSSAYRLRQSACFRAQPAKLGCTACHDAHRASTRAETIARTRGVCVSCHPVAHQRGECVTCHMPTREAEDVPHVEITDHKIGKEIRSFTAAPRNDDVAYGGAAVVYYPEGARAEPVGAVSEVAAVREDTTQGQALLRAGNVKGAISELRKRVNERPEVADIRVNLAAALIAAGDYASAREELQEAIRTGPSIETARGVWMRARAAGATVDEARAGYEASLKVQMLSAHSNLGVVLGLLGKKEDAVTEFRRAVECDPTSEAARANLRRALTR
jgi:predicted CXXCH cytochrome family protein